jgi:raffinose/stachyose/melibiose transport system substrate-binding protein
VTRVRTGLGITAALACVALAAITAGGAGAEATHRGHASADFQPLDRSPANVAKLGKVTLVVEDQETRGATSKTYDTLNKEFQQKYPNVTIKRVTKGFTQLIPTEKLQLATGNAPDVLQINQGFADQGPLVKGKLIVPLDSYAKAWGWTKLPKAGLSPQRMTTDGKHLNAGPLWGIAATMSEVGIYYNRDLLKQLGGSPPKTIAQFHALLDKAKAAGMIPIQQGDSNQAATQWLMTVAEGMYMDSSSLNKIQNGQAGATFAASGLQAAKELKYFGGYMAPGYRGSDDASAEASFIKGKGLFFPNGTWMTGDLTGTMKSKAGFFLPPTQAGKKNVTIYAPNQPWSVASKGKHQALAAMYIDFLLTKHAATLFAHGGDLPMVVTPAPAGSLPVVVDNFNAAATMFKANTGFGYWNGNPKTYDVIQHIGQKVLAGDETPEAYVKQLNDALAQDIKGPS